MPTDERVKVGLIGTGVTLRTHLPGLRRTGQVDVVGIVGRSQQRVEEFARTFDIPQAFTDYRQLCQLADVDLVFVASPNPHHYEQVLYALSQDKHVYAEKPLAMNLEETHELAAVATRSTRLTMVGHQLRFNPYFRKIRDLIQDGQIGRPYFIRLHQQSMGFAKRDAAWTWHFDEELGGGMRLAMGPHLIDLLWFWFGHRDVYAVSSTMDAVVPQRKDLSGTMRTIQTSTFFSATVLLADNLTAQLSTTAAALGGNRFDVSIYGTDGELHFDLARTLVGAFRHGDGTLAPIVVEEQLSQERYHSIFGESFVYFAPQIVQAIRSNSRAPIRDAATFEDAILTQQVLDAMQQATANGQTAVLQAGYMPGATI